MRNMEPFFPTEECKTGDIFLPLKDKRKEKARDQKLEQTRDRLSLYKGKPIPIQFNKNQASNWKLNETAQAIGWTNQNSRQKLHCI